MLLQKLSPLSHRSDNMKLPQDVIAEWVKRGHITQEQATENVNAWVEISYATSKGATMIQGSGAIKSISEGDTTVTYDVGTTVVKGDTVSIDYTAILNRFRRLP